MTPALITKTFTFKEPATYQGLEGTASREVAFTFREDGWFNMTKAAKAFNKRLEHFWDNTGTVDYMVALADLLKVNPGIPGISPEVGSTNFTKLKNTVAETRKGYHTKPQVGTWAHPKLAVFFARWLDVKFAVWCDAVIDDILKGKAEVVITKPEESAVMALPKEFHESAEAMRLQLLNVQREMSEVFVLALENQHKLASLTSVLDLYSHQIGGIQGLLEDIHKATRKPITMPRLQSTPAPGQTILNHQLVSMAEYREHVGIAMSHTEQLQLADLAMELTRTRGEGYRPHTAVEVSKFQFGIIRDAHRFMGERNRSSS